MYDPLDYDTDIKVKIPVEIPDDKKHLEEKIEVGLALVERISEGWITRSPHPGLIGKTVEIHVGEIVKYNTVYVHPLIQDDDELIREMIRDTIIKII